MKTLVKYYKYFLLECKSMCIKASPAPTQGVSINRKCDQQKSHFQILTLSVSLGRNRAFVDHGMSYFLKAMVKTFSPDLPTYLHTYPFLGWNFNYKVSEIISFGGIQLLEYPIPPLSSSVTKTACAMDLGNRATYHRSVGVKMTGKKFWV